MQINIYLYKYWVLFTCTQWVEKHYLHPTKGSEVCLSLKWGNNTTHNPHHVPYTQYRKVNARDIIPFLSFTKCSLPNNGKFLTIMLLEYSLDGTGLTKPSPGITVGGDADIVSPSYIFFCQQVSSQMPKDKNFWKISLKNVKQLKVVVNEVMKQMIIILLFMFICIYIIINSWSIYDLISNLLIMNIWPDAFPFAMGGSLNMKCRHIKVEILACNKLNFEINCKEQ